MRFVLLLLASLLAAFICGRISFAATTGIRAVTVTSFGWDGFGGTFSDAMIRAMKADGADTLVFAITSTVDPNTDVITAQNGEPNARLAHAIGVAQAAGLRVGLKLEFLAPDGNTLASNLFSPADPAAFFASYKAIVLGWAQYARAYGMSLLVIGTEMGGYLTGPALYRPIWTDIVTSVRARFKGAVTYAAGAGVLPSRYYTATKPDWSWEYDEATHVSFWSALDYVGLDAYPILAAGPNPPSDLAAALVAAPDTIDHSRNRFDWPSHWDAEIRAGGKPGLITEMGAPSTAGALMCPGCWAMPGAAPDELAQSLIYALLLGRFMSDPLVSGIMIHANNAYLDQHYRTGFSFYGKLAETVLRAMWK